MNLIPKDKVDYMVPVFILNYLPHGLIGLVVVAILAAFMSSLDSAINSLSAATMRDIYQKYIKPNGSDTHYFLWSKIFTVFWGVVCTLFAFLVGAISETVIESINKVGSVFYGPILAAFILAIMVKRATPAAAKIGVVSGVLVNLVLWVGFPRVSWLWWNATGCIAALLVAYLWSTLAPQPKPTESTVKDSDRINWTPRYAFLALYFFGIIVLSYVVGSIWV
jgi:SSS family solute:Na+ symporter